MHAFVRVFRDTVIILIFHEKHNKMACAPSEDSDQPGHPPSLIRVFTVRMKKVWVLSYPLSAQRKLVRLGGCHFVGCDMRWLNVFFASKWFQTQVFDYPENRLTLSTLGKKADDSLNIFLIFPKKQVFTFQANGLQWRRFA